MYCHWYPEFIARTLWLKGGYFQSGKVPKITFPLGKFNFGIYGSPRIESQLGSAAKLPTHKWGIKGQRTLISQSECLLQWKYFSENVVAVDLTNSVIG